MTPIRNERPYKFPKTIKPHTHIYETHVTKFGTQKFSMNISQSKTVVNSIRRGTVSSSPDSKPWRNIPKGWHTESGMGCGRLRRLHKPDSHSHPGLGNPENILAHKYIPTTTRTYRFYRLIYVFFPFFFVCTDGSTLQKGRQFKRITTAGMLSGKNGYPAGFETKKEHMNFKF